MLLVLACRAIGDVPALGASPPLNLGDGQLSVSLGSARTLRSAFTAALVQSIARRKYNGVRATTCRMAEFGMALDARNSAPFRTEPSGDRKCAESVTSSERSSVSEVLSSIALAAVYRCMTISFRTLTEFFTRVLSIAFLK